MIKQGLAERTDHQGLLNTSIEMKQTTYDELYRAGQAQGRAHCIEGRIYAEDPYRGFSPSPGLLQHVLLDDTDHDWLRVDKWVTPGYLNDAIWCLLVAFCERWKLGLL